MPPRAREPSASKSNQNRKLSESDCFLLVVRFAAGCFHVCVVLLGWAGGPPPALGPRPLPPRPGPPPSAPGPRPGPHPSVPPAPGPGPIRPFRVTVQLPQEPTDALQWRSL